MQTHHLPISGGDVGGSKNIDAFIEKKAKEGNNRFGWSLEEGRELAKRYGSNIDLVFTYAQEHKEKGMLALPNSLYAQLHYAIYHEAVIHPVDFLLRRTGYLLFDMPYLLEWKDEVIADMDYLFQWDAQTKEQLVKELQTQIDDAREPADWH